MTKESSTLDTEEDYDNEDEENDDPGELLPLSERYKLFISYESGGTSYDLDVRSVREFRYPKRSYMFSVVCSPEAYDEMKKIRDSEEKIILIMYGDHEYSETIMYDMKLFNLSMAQQDEESDWIFTTLIAEGPRYPKTNKPMKIFLDVPKI